MAYDVMIIAAHPDDAEVQTCAERSRSMGGTIVKLVRKGYSVLIVDLSDGEPADFAEPGVRREQARRAAEILGADRLLLEEQDRLIEDDLETRLKVTRLIREHRPRWVFGTAEACIHPDHAAVEPIVTAAVTSAGSAQGSTPGSRTGIACPAGRRWPAPSRGKSSGCSSPIVKWSRPGAISTLRQAQDTASPWTSARRTH